MTLAPVAWCAQKQALSAQNMACYSWNQEFRNVSSEVAKKLLDAGRTREYIARVEYIGGPHMKQYVRVMKALSDPNRVAIVKMLQHREMCVCEIQAALHIAQPTVSKHLKVLEDAGLVVSRKDRVWVNYHLSDGSDSPYVASILGNLRHWLEDDPRIADLLKRLPTIRREEVCKR
jgi:ArsR family transcriptional regulator